MQILLEAAAKTKGNNAFVMAVLKDSSTLIQALEPALLKGELGETMHEIFFGFAQVFVEQGIDPQQAIKILQVKEVPYICSQPML